MAGARANIIFIIYIKEIIIILVFTLLAFAFTLHRVITHKEKEKKRPLYYLFIFLAVQRLSATFGTAPNGWPHRVLIDPKGCPFFFKGGTHRTT